MNNMTDLEMMRDPYLWPNLCLPLIHRRLMREGGSSEKGIGILWYPIGGKKGISKYSFLEGHNMFMPIPKDAKWVTGGDELLVKLINEGWEID